MSARLWMTLLWVGGCTGSEAAGDAALRAGQPLAAIEQYRAAIPLGVSEQAAADRTRLVVKICGARVALGEQRAAEGRLPNAWALFRKVEADAACEAEVGRAREAMTAWSTRYAETLLAEGRWEEAVAEHERAGRASEVAGILESQGAWRRLALHHGARREWALAARAWDEVGEDLVAAQLYERAGDAAAAAALYGEERRWVDQGSMLLAAGRPRDAVAVFEAAPDLLDAPRFPGQVRLAAVGAALAWAELEDAERSEQAWVAAFAQARAQALPEVVVELAATSGRWDLATRALLGLADDQAALGEAYLAAQALTDARSGAANLDPAASASLLRAVTTREGALAPQLRRYPELTRCDRRVETDRVSGAFRFVDVSADLRNRTGRNVYNVWVRFSLSGRDAQTWFAARETDAPSTVWEAYGEAPPERAIELRAADLAPGDKRTLSRADTRVPYAQLRCTLLRLQAQP